MGLCFLALGQQGPCAPPPGPGDTGGDSGSGMPDGSQGSGTTGTTAGDSLGGTVDVGDFTVPAGQTTRVTSDLVINASGGVSIDGDLVADPAKIGAGCGIVIRADGDVTINGTVQAGDGASTSATSLASIRRNAAGDSATGIDGEDGAALQIVSGGNITVGNSASLICGNGTDGTSGTRGGRGGDGGNIVLCAGNRLTVRGWIQMGHGGDGGHAQTTSDDNGIGLFPNDGGNSGSLYVNAMSYDWPGFDSNDMSIDPIAHATQTGNLVIGGYGGNAGGLTVLDDLGTCAFDSTHQVTDPDLIVIVGAGHGGHGWSTGGGGGSVIFFSCKHGGLDGRDGTNWYVVGGEGGSVTRREDTTIACVAFPVVVVGAWAGNGGTAGGIAAPGLLGDSLHLDGGNGGHMRADGGAGGHGEFFANHTGGAGGRAVASAGFGGHGWCRDCYDLGVGGNGGNGGNASAEGGTGGNGVTPGEGGVGEALGAGPLDTAGGGGDGGDGFPPGSGGAGGEVSSILGADGITGPLTIVSTVEKMESAPNGSPGSYIDPSMCQ